MKKLFILSLLISNFQLLTTFAQTGVVIDYKISAGDSRGSVSGNTKMYSQDGNTRSEMQMNIQGLPMGAINTVTLTRKDKPNTIVTLNAGNKTYTEMSYEQAQPEERKSNEPFEVTVVGKETVNGYSCTHVIAKFKNSGKMRNEWWTSKDVAGFSGFSGLKGTKYLDDDNFFSKMAEKGADGFPVRMKMSEAGAAGSFQMDLVKAEKKNLESSLFEIPAGYTKAATVDLSNMPKSMQEIQNMSPEEQQKMLQEMMKMYQGQMPADKP
ncbi:MAG: DUF4412 domain-containing protein [Bacteroidia bacterium]